MSNHTKCVMCESIATQKEINYESGEFDLSGIEIVIPNVKMNYCSNTVDCGHSWLSAHEEERINSILTKKTRYFLDSSQIQNVREALGFATKTAASNFLTLNSKAFTKWENSYTDLNSANDLLLRLAIFSRSNFNFIKDLHAKKFHFDPNDYELLCTKNNNIWNYEYKINPVLNVEAAFVRSNLEEPGPNTYSNSITQPISESSSFEFILDRKIA